MKFKELEKKLEKIQDELDNQTDIVSLLIASESNPKGEMFFSVNAKKNDLINTLTNILVQRPDLAEIFLTAILISKNQSGDKYFANEFPIVGQA